MKTMPFCEGVAKLLKEQQEYEERVVQKPEPTEADEAAALQEVGEMTDIQETLEPVSDEVLNG
jgi:hypothetical protein